MEVVESIDIDLFDNIQQGSCDEEEVCERTKRKTFQAGKPLVQLEEKGSYAFILGVISTER